ncbi:TPA: hypothetical protein ACH3X2_003934 [Trebouxia sp. C0005]
MALAPPTAGSLADTHTTQKVTSHLGHHVHSHGTVRSQAAHQCKLEHQLGRTSRASWGSSASYSRQRHSPRQKRGHSAIVYADQDYYSVLGISKNADKQAIKSAYRQKARKFHPDVNKEPGAEDTFKSISNAYEVLSDEQKRGIYDRYGEAGLKGGMGGMGGGEAYGSPFDIFEQFFGGQGGGMGGMGGQTGPRRARPIPGEDERYDIQLDFLDAVFGTQKDISVSRLEECGVCTGSGVKAGTTASTCSTCGGQGQVVTVQRTPIGAFQQIATCADCEGTGERATPCNTCGGDGRVRRTKKISLNVPPGVDNGSRLRVRGEGSSGRKGGSQGDLYVFVRVKEHADLRREGLTVHSDVSVSYVDAILGTTVKVTTVDGLVDLKIPGGTQPGTTLVMSKRGVPRLGVANSRGDHQVHVRVEIPTKLSNDERKIIEELREIQAKKPVKKKGFSIF